MTTKAKEPNEPPQNAPTSPDIVPGTAPAPAAQKSAHKPHGRRAHLSGTRAQKSTRSRARLAAVQALYQMDLAGTDLTAVIAEFEHERIPKARMDDLIAGADVTFMAELLRGVVRRQQDIDVDVDNQLAAGWRLVRVDAILRAILRSGVFELMERLDVPARVVINEYIDIAHAFLSDDEPKVVNGVLDRLARKMRPDEFDQPQSNAGGE